MDSTTTSTGTGTSYTINYGNEVRYGWVCPLCGRANAPWLGQCPCQPKKTWTFTSPLEWDPKPYCTTATNIKDDMTWSDYRATDE